MSTKRDHDNLARFGITAPKAYGVSMANVQRLSSIREALLSELSGNDARLRFINTRLILSIGVNLILIKPSEDADPRRVSATLETLQKMGFLKQEGNRGS